MPGVIIRGRWAWIASIVLGAVLLVIGIVLGQIVVICVGVGFIIFGVIFLILSFVTGGQTD